jgi:hypothetical protein
MTTRVLQIITDIQHVPDTRSAYRVVLACATGTSPPTAT